MALATRAAGAGEVLTHCLREAMTNPVRVRQAIPRHRRPQAWTPPQRLLQVDDGVRRTYSACGRYEILVLNRWPRIGQASYDWRHMP